MLQSHVSVCIPRCVFESCGVHYQTRPSQVISLSWIETARKGCLNAAVCVHRMFVILVLYEHLADVACCNVSVHRSLAVSLENDHTEEM